jgi:glycosyltransferase involved in cell wall biosynthesis
LAISRVALGSRGGYVPWGMWRGARISVVVPAFCEERLIGRVLGSLPDFVDHVVVVDDASPDATSSRVRDITDPRIQLIRHQANRGVGAAIATGYAQALAAGSDVLTVMAGDAQMDPAELPSLLEPIVSGRADYVKGNRFIHRGAAEMPITRRLGGALLSLLTRAATGLRIDDSQCGYTALRADTAARLELGELWPRYGYPNDLLGMLAAEGCRVEEVPVRPIYGDEQSGMRPWHVALIAGVIARRAAQSARYQEASRAEAISSP